jgi:hypothetical protein
MQAVGPAQLLVLLAAVAIVAAASGFLGSVVMRRRKRRAGGVFVLGFLCGLTAGPLLRLRRRIRRALGPVVGRHPRRAETRSDAYRLAARALALTASRSRS